MFWRSLSFERLYPYGVGLSGLGASVICGLCFTNSGFTDVLNASITFSSILVGFIGALLAILVSIRDSEIIGYIFSVIDKDIFHSYFREAIVSGVVTVISSALLFVAQGDLRLWGGRLWLGIVLFFMCASYRVINILLAIVFKDKEAIVRAPQGNGMTPEEADEYARIIPHT